MSVQEQLAIRSGSKCELCTSTDSLSVYEVPPIESNNVDHSIMLCEICLTQLQDPASMDANHWRCLNDSMWSEYPVVQVMAWRALNDLTSEDWAQNLQSQMYMDEQTTRWAQAMQSDSDAKPTLDSNGAKLAAGDSVTLIKDLVVKGANFTAKRGTLVRNISLTDDPKHIEGRVNGTHIVLVAAFLKKV
jgi:protein PhnA